jgi:hypothetical protein
MAEDLLCLYALSADANDLGTRDCSSARRNLLNRSDPSFHGGSGIDAGRKEHSRQRGRPGTDMDTAHSVDPARGFPQKTFSKQIPMKRPGQPAELTTAYDVLADPLSNYLSGATTAVTGGKPFP